MHMADALLSPSVAGTMYVASAGAAAYSIKKIKSDSELEKIPLMGVMGAFVFATQMLNFTIPGTGSSGHLCGGMLLSALLGPFAGFLTMIGVLFIQALFFADGGLLALGANVWNMAFYGCFIGSLLIWRPFMKKGASRAKIILASVLGCVLTLQLGAFSVTVQTLASGITELPFGLFVATMQPIHLAIGTVEGLITAAVLIFIYEARPEFLWGIGQKDVSVKKAKMSKKVTLGILGAVAVFFAGVLSLFASAFPDGLEWSMEKVAGTAEPEVATGIHSFMEKIQSATSFLPDYAFKDNEAAAGTSVSGIVGGILVLLLLVGISSLVRLISKKNSTKDKE